MARRSAHALLLLGVAIGGGCSGQETANKAGDPQSEISEPIALPKPRLEGPVSLEEALHGRRSVREFAEEELTRAEISQLLWAAQGTTHPDGYRTAPSAGALYPLEIYLASAEGFYRYEPRRHLLIPLSGEDFRPGLYEAALEQEPVREAPGVVLIAAVYERTSRKYGAARSPQYVHLEAGHAAQNLLLQAVALGLGAVPIGAFEEERIKALLSLPADEEPLYLIPVGRRRTG